MVVCLILLLITLFIYLRLFGVPESMLRKGLDYARRAGVPVEVDDVYLTLRGWRATNVRYLSVCAEDRCPLVFADQVYFSVGRWLDGLELDVDAIDVKIAPSMNWGVQIPADSDAGRMERVKVSLRFLPDSIVLSRAETVWQNIRFRVNGTVIKGRDTLTFKKSPTRRTYVSALQFREWEKRLKLLQLPNGADVNVEFWVDARHYQASWCRFNVVANPLRLNGVDFRQAVVDAVIAHPSVSLDRAELFFGTESMKLTGEFDWATKSVRGTLDNHIISDAPLSLLPLFVSRFMEREELVLRELPHVELSFGPAPVSNLLNHISGHYAVNRAVYKDLSIRTLSGRVKREEDRLELYDIKADVDDADYLAERFGSAMRGGSVQGGVFWDARSGLFGVFAETRGDPNLLVRALAPVEIATNIIRRFRIPTDPPEIKVKLGANVHDWDTFYINISGKGEDVIFEGVRIGSVDVTAAYSNGVLRLDPLWGQQGESETKGWAEVDFYKNTVAFDATSSMNPADLEDMIYSDFNLFGNHLVTTGKTSLTAKGIIDWDDMQQTDFVCEAEAEHLKTPAAIADRLTCRVQGKGPLVSVKQAVFDVYGGACSGDFSFMLDPSDKEIPYELDLNYSGVSLKDWLRFLSKNDDQKVSGKMHGKALIRADLSRPFMESLNGEADLVIKDGQLADLPLFEGFSKLMRTVIPGFRIFSFTRLDGNFTMKDGVVSSDNVRLEGDIISVLARGSYEYPKGFDALMQVQMLRDNTLSSVVRVVTDPFFKLLEIRLRGPYSDPSWRLDKLPEVGKDSP